MIFKRNFFWVVAQHFNKVSGADGFVVSRQGVRLQLVHEGGVAIVWQLEHYPFVVGNSAIQVGTYTL